MKLDCNITRDLLPLYIEKMVSEQTADLVDEHLATCESCKAYRNSLSEDTVMPSLENDASRPLKTIKMRIEQRKREIALFCSLLICLGMFLVFSYLSRPQYVSLQSSGVEVTKLDDGRICVSFAEQVTSVHVEQYRKEGDIWVAEVAGWSSILDSLLEKSSPAIILDANVSLIYYCDYTEDDNMHVIYGRNPLKNGGMITLPRLVLGYYFKLAFGVSVILGILWLIFRKHTKWLFHLFFVPVSYMLSEIIQGIGFTSFSAERDFILILIAGILIYSIVILGRRLWFIKKGERKVGI